MRDKETSGTEPVYSVLLQAPASCNSVDVSLSGLPFPSPGMSTRMDKEMRNLYVQRVLKVRRQRARVYGVLLTRGVPSEPPVCQHHLAGYIRPTPNTRRRASPTCPNQHPGGCAHYRQQCSANAHALQPPAGRRGRHAQTEAAHCRQSSAARINLQTANPRAPRTCPQGDVGGMRKLKLHIADPPNRKHMVFLGGAVLADIMKVGGGWHVG